MRTRRLRTIGAVCAGLLVASTVTVVTMSQANAAVIDTSAWYNIVARHSGKAIEITGGSTADQATVTQNTRSSANHQQFQFVDSGGGYYRLRARHSNKVIDLFEWNVADGAEFRQWPDTNGANQQFRVLDSDGGYVRLINRHSNKAMDVWENSAANGARVSQFSDLNGPNQQFQLVRAGTGTTPTTPGPGTTTQAPPPPPGSTNCNVAPINPRATAAARRLLCYVYSVYGRGIISGQQESTWIGGADYEINHIRNTTGKLPAIRGLDMGDSPNFGSRAVAWWNAGGIPMVGYHMGSPSNSA
ncbi:MAG TPA: RICIN domain-containing protein, partial [Pilimelia sp.]|nr:RICIN domain-containing protein [Pilimelia sp.]